MKAGNGGIPKQFFALAIIIALVCLTSSGCSSLLYSLTDDGRAGKDHDDFVREQREDDFYFYYDEDDWRKIKDCNEEERF